MYVQGKIKKFNDGIQDVLIIREKVFNLELNIPSMSFEDLEDKNAYFAIVYRSIENQNNDLNKVKAVATGRLILNNFGNYKIERIAVLPEERGNQYGDMVVKMLIHKAFELGGTEVYVASRKESVQFYKKIGFNTVNKNVTEHGIELELMSIKEENIAKKCKNIQ